MIHVIKKQELSDAIAEYLSRKLNKSIKGKVFWKVNLDAVMDDEMLWAEVVENYAGKEEGVKS